MSDESKRRKKKTLITCEEFPKEVENYFLCLLFHNRQAQWDGSYRYDEILQERVPNIRYFCDHCQKEHLVKEGVVRKTEKAERLP